MSRSPYRCAGKLRRNRLAQQGPRVVSAVERAQRTFDDLPAVLAALELPAVCADTMDAEAGRAAVSRDFARRGLPVRRDDLQIGDGDRAVAVDLDARQPGEVAKASGNRGLVLGRFHQAADRVDAARALAAAEVHLAVGDERFTIVEIGPGIGGRRVTGDEV